MFGKKKAQQPDDDSPWVVQVLTRDFLIEGFTPADDDLASNFLEVEVGEDMNGSLLVLSQPNLQPVGATAVGLPANSKFVLPANTEFVAVIPGNDEALAYAVKHAGQGNTAIGAVVLAAQYVLRGTVLCPSGGLEMLSDYVLFAMQDATIEYAGPGARLAKMDVPFLLVRTSQVQGFFVNA